MSTPLNPHAWNCATRDAQRFIDALRAQLRERGIPDHYIDVIFEHEDQPVPLLAWHTPRANLAQG